MFVQAHGKDLPEHDEDTVDRSAELKLACLHAHNPNMTQAEASAALTAGFLLEHPETYQDVEVPEDLLAEVFTATETKKVHEYHAALSQVKAKKDVMNATASMRVASYFKKGPAPRYPPRLQNKPQWIAERTVKTTDSVVAWVEKHLPPSVRLNVDHIAGRVKIHGAKPQQQKSVAWTQRGWRPFAMECLHVAWTFHEDFSGHKPPFDIASLASEFDAA